VFVEARSFFFLFPFLFFFPRLAGSQKWLAVLRFLFFPSVIAFCDSLALPGLAFLFPIPAIHDEFSYPAGWATRFFVHGRLANPLYPSALEKFENSRPLGLPRFPPLTAPKYPPGSCSFLCGRAGHCSAIRWIGVPDRAPRMVAPAFCVDALAGVMVRQGGHFFSRESFSGRPQAFLAVAFVVLAEQLLGGPGGQVGRGRVGALGPRDRFGFGPPQSKARRPCAGMGNLLGVVFAILFLTSRPYEVFFFFPLHSPLGRHSLCGGFGGAEYNQAETRPRTLFRPCGLNPAGSIIPAVHGGPVNGPLTPLASSPVSRYPCPLPYAYDAQALHDRAAMLPSGQKPKPAISLRQRLRWKILQSVRARLLRSRSCGLLRNRLQDRETLLCLAFLWPACWLLVPEFFSF